MQDVIALFDSQSDISSEEYNDLLLKSISTIEKQDKKAEEDLNNAYAEMSEKALYSDPFKEAYDNACSLLESYW